MKWLTRAVVVGVIISVLAIVGALVYMVDYVRTSNRVASANALKEIEEIRHSQIETRAQARRTEATIIGYIECILLVDRGQFDDRRHLKHALRVCAEEGTIPESAETAPASEETVTREVVRTEHFHHHHEGQTRTDHFHHHHPDKAACDNAVTEATGDCK